MWDPALAGFRAVRLKRRTPRPNGNRSAGRLRRRIRYLEDLRRFGELQCADSLWGRGHPGLAAEFAIKLHCRIAELLQRSILRGTMTVGASRGKDVSRVRSLHW